MILKNLSMIVCMARNRVIGIGDKMPWHKPNEYKLFLSKVQGHGLIFGRKNFLINLDNTELIQSTNDWIIFTRQPQRYQDQYQQWQIDHQKTLSFMTLEDYFQNVIDLPSDHYFVVGGQDIYEAFMPHVGQLYLTILEDSYDGNIIFPDHEFIAWKSKTLVVTDDQERWSCFQFLH